MRDVASSRVSLSGLFFEERKLNEQKIEDALEIERQQALLTEMGIDPTESEKLRNTMLSPSEAVAAKSEELTNAIQKRGRKEDWEEWVDAKRRMGRVMHHSEFIRRLRTIIPNLVVSRARVNGCLSLYEIKNTPTWECPEYVNPRQLNFFDKPEYIGWIAMGDMPEYEIDIINNFQVPIGQKRGWRTILIRLIARWEHEKTLAPTIGMREFADKLDPHGRRIRARRSSIITEQQALEAFGLPTQGITASAYRQQLFNFRNAVPDPVPVKRY